MSLGQFTVWNQVTDAMKWRRGRYGREEPGSAHGLTGGLGRSASGAGLGLEFENSDALDGLPLDRANVWNLRIRTSFSTIFGR